jgi:hypothetical protein
LFKSGIFQRNCGAVSSIIEMKYNTDCRTPEVFHHFDYYIDGTAPRFIIE